MKAAIDHCRDEVEEHIETLQKMYWFMTLESMKHRNGFYCDEMYIKGMKDMWNQIPEDIREFVEEICLEGE